MRLRQWPTAEYFETITEVQDVPGYGESHSCEATYITVITCKGSCTMNLFPSLGNKYG